MAARYCCVRQQDESDCGAAVLATIALHHRMPIGLQKMRDLCGTDRVGTNLLGLVGAAENLGFSARAVKGPYDALPDVPLPAIVHVVTEQGLGHFVVLHRLTKTGVVVADPASGIEQLSEGEFCKKWTGYVLILAPGADGAAAAIETVSLKPWRRLLRLLRPHTPILAEAFVAALLMTALGIMTSFFIGHLVDSVLVHSEWRMLNALAFGMLAIVLFRALFGVLRQYLLAYVGRKVDLMLISDYTRHVLRLPMNFFEMRRVGEILSRVNDAVKVREAVSGTSLTAVVDGTLVIITAGFMFYYDWPLALVACCFVPTLLASAIAHHPAAKRLSRQAMEDAAVLQAHLIEDVSAVETIKAYRIERSRSDDGESRLVKLVQSSFSLQKLGISMGSLGTLIPGAAGIVILWYGGHRVIDGAMTIGQLMFFYTLLGYMLQPLERLASVNLQIQDALIAVDRIYQIMEIEREDPDDAKKAVFVKVEQGLELNNVSFKYGCRSNVLENVNMRIPAGATVAIVGESGSGKTTLLKLLMRFYDPTDGRILMDGRNLRDITLSSLRSGIALVSQDPFIFNGTIRENIGLAKPNATSDEIVRAARAAELDEFISGMPDRYETMIGERGANLSGGQRQRLAIARALLMSPEILIFDEATSHLDTATERSIQHNLKESLKGKTTILVAHRLSTICDADVIYVLRGGKVVEQGPHADLLAADGYYASLHRAQYSGSMASTEARNREVALDVAGSRS